MKILKNSINFFLSFLFIELLFRVIVGFSIFNWAVLRIILGLIIISLGLGFVFSFLKDKKRHFFSILVIFIVAVYAFVQVGFKNYFGNYMSLQGTGLIHEVKGFILPFIQSVPIGAWCFFLPFLGSSIYYGFLYQRHTHTSKRIFLTPFYKKPIFLTILMTLFFLRLYSISLTISFMQNKTQVVDNEVLFQKPYLSNLSVNQFGILVYSFLDIKSLFITEEHNDSIYYKKYIKPKQKINENSRVMDDSYLEEYSASTGENDYKAITNYILSQKITDRNEYTGFFKDKNLIVVMVESGSNALLNEKYFPNVSKLYNEGWAWTNSYSPLSGCSTIDNEIGGLASTYQFSDFCGTDSYKNTVYSESLFNVFKRQGYDVTSYHNYCDKYYNRKTIHKNLGSEYYYNADDLGISYVKDKDVWPSDVLLMEKFLDTTKDKKHFMAWITTVSSHGMYNTSSEFGDKYLDLFKDEDYGKDAKRYLSKLKEVDNAIGVLLDGLEEQGKLEDTVIVLYGDHYPFTLVMEQYLELFDEDISVRRELDRTPFIIYNKGMEPHKFDDYTSFMNLAPTIANLFDLEYDPRLYFGEDLFSEDYDGIVVFPNGMWQTKDAFYNAATNEIKCIKDCSEYTDEKIQEINKMVFDKITFSQMIIKNNYYRFYEDLEK